MFFILFFTNILDVAATNINTANGDYSLAGATVLVADSANAAALEVTIDPDTDFEDTECFEIVLSNPTSGTLEDCHLTTTVCIKDDDTSSK